MPVLLGCLYPLILGWLAVVAHNDLKYQRISNSLVICGLCGAGALACVVHRPWWCLLGGLALFSVYLWGWIGCRGIGGGDVKLTLPIGAITAVGGEGIWLVASCAALLMTVAWGVYSAQYAQNGHQVPHGVSMAVSASAAIMIMALRL